MCYEKSIGNRNAFSLLTWAVASLSLQLAVSNPAMASVSNAASAVSVYPSVLAFGNQVEGSPTAPQAISLTNGGAAAVSIASIAVTGGQADDFPLSNNCGSSLAAGASCTIAVFFSPVSAGAKSAWLTISDSANGSPQRIGLTGEGTVAAGLLMFNLPSLGFGAVSVGSDSSQYVSVTNGGNAVVAFTSIAITGGEADDFSQSNSCGTSLPPGAFCTITVRFLPVSAGTKSASLSLTDTASGSPQRVLLTGTGSTSATVLLGNNTLTFGDQLAGSTSSSQSVSVENSGSIPLTFGAILVTGGQADDFSQSNNCGTTLPAYTTCTVSVSFKPVSAGSKSATLSIADNATGSPQHVSLSGLGQPLPALGLNSIFPSTVVSGGSDFTLTAVGQGFTSSALIYLNGAPLPTAYVSEAQLRAQVPAGDIASTGVSAVTVGNSPGNGAPSTSLTLKVNAATPDAVAFQITAGHSGAVTFNTVALPALSTWSVDVGGPPSYAIIAEGKVVVTVAVGSGTQLLALDQQTGSIVWGPVEIAGAANAAYGGGKIVTVTAAGLMQSFDLSSGHSDWATQLVGQLVFTSGPTVLNGIAFTGGAEDGGTLYAVSEATGAILWTQSVQNGDDSTPAVTDQGVYVTYPCWTYAFQPSTGIALFSNNTGCEGGGGAAPVVADNVLYAPNGTATYDGETFNATTGALLGSYVADVPPAIGTDMGYFLASGSLSGIALSSSTVVWSFVGDGSLVTSPILVNQTVIIGSSTGNLYALNAATGQQVWTVNAGGPIPAGAKWGAPVPLAALAAGDGLLIVPAGNRVVAYTLSTTP